MSLACVFPGQGSQSVGMLAELAEYRPMLLDTFHAVSDKLGIDVWQLIQNGPEAMLNQTEHTQVAMLSADVAVYRLLRQSGMMAPKIMAGHSLGEYAALVCAEAIDLASAAMLVAKRGQLMQQAAPEGHGAMAALIGLSNEDVLDICLLSSTPEEQVTPSNFNAIGQVVIAGHTAAILNAISLATLRGALMAKLIPVSVPCHCFLLNEAAEEFEDFLASAPFKIPNTRVISTVDLTDYQTPRQIQSLLKQQLVLPVRWVDTIQLIQSNRVQWVVECGPGKVLSGLIKRIDKSLPTLSVYDPSTLEQTLRALLTSAKEFSHD